MKIRKQFQALGMLVLITALGCANRNACSPYPGYSPPYQAYPYGYSGQPGAPIQGSPMVGTPQPGAPMAAAAPGTIPTYPVPAAGYPLPQGGPAIPPGYGYSQQPILGR